MIASSHLVNLLSSVYQLRFECCDKELRLLRQVKDKLGDGFSIFCIKCIVKFIHYVEGSSFNLQDCEEERGCHYRLLTTT